MLHFRSLKDAEGAAIDEQVRKVVVARIADFERAIGETGNVWDVDRDGHFSFLAAEEIDPPLAGMGWTQRLGDLLFEFTHFHPEANLWEVAYVPGNNWGWTCFFHDSPDLPKALRETLLREAVPP